MVCCRSLGRHARLVIALLLTVISENGVRLRLNIVDTPGYGDVINNEGWCAPKRLRREMRVDNGRICFTAGTLSSSTSR